MRTIRTGCPWQGHWPVGRYAYRLLYVDVPICVRLVDPLTFDEGEG